jgi:hypothetical protein
VCKVIHPLLESSDPLEFSSTDGLEDGGKFFVQTNPLRLVHIVHTSVSKLSMAEVLILLHLCDGMDGDIIAIHGQRNVVVCRIADRSRGLMRRSTKDEDHVESCDPLPERDLEPRLDGPDENARFTPPIHFFILHSTCNYNTQ